MKDCEYDVSLITREGIDALLHFLPYFNDDRARFGTEVSITDGCIAPSILTPKSMEFYEACYEHNFVQDFDWGEWSQSRQGMVSCGEGIEDLDLAGIGRLLTAHIRGDRFCDGHLLGVMRSGQMAHILERLMELIESTTSPMHASLPDSDMPKPFNKEEIQTKKQTRAPKQLGDFGEGLVNYALIRKGFEVACVDHVGADLIAEKQGSRFAISVKTRLFKTGSKESLCFQAEYDHLDKLERFASQFGMKPVFGLVICIADENAIHLLLARVEDIRNNLPKVKHGYSFRFSKTTRQKLFEQKHIDYSCWTGEVIGKNDFV